MSASEETLIKPSVNLTAPGKSKESLFTSFLDLLGSVRFGIVLLILLGLACLIGMLIMQQNMEGFENYYAQLTPSQKLVYGKLGFFDIYHSWHFNGLLAVLSLNIILSSIDRFPKTWILVSKPNFTVPLRWLKTQKPSESFLIEGESRQAVAENIARRFKKAGWRKAVISEKNNRTFVFAQSGAWNRLGAYAVHVALLLIFLGGFMTAQIGNTGQMPLAPGQISDRISDVVVIDVNQTRQISNKLPFEVVCLDIQQKLIRNDGSLSAGNTIDWMTRIKIKDGNQTQEAVVQMNRPFDYRGYRFFQASFVPTGRARNITLRVADKGGAVQEISIPRDGEAALADGTKIKFDDFRANFTLGKEDPNEDSSSYTKPGAILRVTPAGETAAQTAYALTPEMSNIPVAKKAIAGYTFQLIDFEKVGEQHILSVQHDPGAKVVYLGFALLSLTLVAVFFFSHQRVWAVVEETSENKFDVVIAGNTNRNQTPFEEKFKRFTANLHGQNKEIL